MENGRVMIHVRFSPDGTVVEIGERPAGAKPQTWFDCLSDKAATSYQSLSGGRGVFRVARDEVETWKAALVSSGTAS
jgi:hypothetical protein